MLRVFPPGWKSLQQLEIWVQDMHSYKQSKKAKSKKFCSPTLKLAFFSFLSSSEAPQNSTLLLCFFCMKKDSNEVGFSSPASTELGGGSLSSWGLSWAAEVCRSGKKGTSWGGCYLSLPVGDACMWNE